MSLISALSKRTCRRRADRESVVAQVGFEKSRLVVGAIEDGVVAELAAMFETMRLQLHDDALGLGFIVATGRDVDRIAMPELRPQFLSNNFSLWAMTLLAALRMRTVDR